MVSPLQKTRLGLPKLLRYLVSRVPNPYQTSLFVIKCIAFSYANRLISFSDTRDSGESAYAWWKCLRKLCIRTYLCLLILHWVVRSLIFDALSIRLQCAGCRALDIATTIDALVVANNFCVSIHSLQGQNNCRYLQLFRCFTPTHAIDHIFTAVLRPRRQWRWSYQCPRLCGP